MSVFTLKIGSREIDVMENIRVSKNLQNMSNAFVLDMTNISMGDPTGWDFNLNDECEILLDDVTLMSGYIDNFDFEYSPTTARVIITGRDEVADLIDCSFSESVNEWKNQSIQSIVKRLCDPFGIDVATASDATTYVTRIIPEFKADEGDFISDILIRLCRDNGILPISLGDGKLTLTRAVPTVLAADPLQIGGNVVVAHHIQCNLERYSTYKVKGIGMGADTKQLVDFIEPFGSATDSVIGRPRTLTIFADGNADNGSCQRRARWESCIRAGNSRRYYYTLPSLMQSDGTLWDINMLVRVVDPIMDIDAQMLIDSVDYIKRPNPVGECIIIGVVDKRTYQGTTQASQIKGRFD